ncbi:MAG: glucoamylase family protein, partial [Fibrobacteria bacterium]
MRGEIFSADHLESHAATLAAQQGGAKARRRGFPLLRRVRENGAALHAAHLAITRTSQSQRGLTPAAEWLADNFHVVDEQLREIRNHLPRDYYLELPKLAHGALKDYPRVYAVICAYIAHTDSRLDAEILGRFVRAYQTVQPLTTGELWAVAITLRIALIENLRRLADLVVGGRDARIKADRVADQILGLRTAAVTEEASTRDWARFGDSPYFDAFAVQIFQRIQDQTTPASPALDWLDGELARRGLSSQEIIRLEHQKQAALNVSVRNIITSMRLVLELDWKEFFETASHVEAILRASPGYKDMDFDSRDLYRHAIEDLARGSGLSESEIAIRAVKAIDAHSPGSTGEAGYYLIGPGRAGFQTLIRYRWRYLEFTGMLIKRNAIWAYPLLIAAVTVLFAVQGAETLAHSGLGTAAALLLAVLGAVPLSEGAMALVNRIVTSLVPPRILPKLDFSKGIPPDCRTLVVVPTLLQGLDEVRELLQRIEVHFLANPDGDIRFALLSDWADARLQILPGDGDLLQAAVEGMEELNARYGEMPDGGARFLLLHRERRWNAREGVWMGWERKRGKLNELNRLLRGDRGVSFLLEGPKGPMPVPTGVRYVITLDTDTRLPKGAAARLAGCMAHPLNRARFDTAAGKVAGGYGILQPRVVPSLPEARERTLFHRVTSGPCGIDPYAAAVSDVYQDLFGEGSFTGKGIYDVDAFEDSLRNRIPENALLSHDLFEGSFARAGLLTDVEVLEDFPSHYQVHAARQHRWARGDWQLLPWILGRGGRGLPFLGRWKMIDNLRRCLVAPCAFLALALGWSLAAQPPVAWTALVLVALLLPYLIAAAEAITEPSADVSFRHYLRDLAGGLLQALSHYVLTIVLLAHQAWLLSDAAVRTLLRLTLTRKRLLEWTTAAQSATRLRKGLSGSYRGMAAAVALPAVVAYLCLLFRHPANLALAAPLLILWAASPALALLASTPRRVRPWENLTAEEIRGLRHTALKTWRFFRAFVGPGDNHLPPDNFQEDPKPVLAHRTSPTNMGLCLLSIATARDLGWLGLGECAQRLEAVLGSMLKLERYRGHFFNWYETRDLRVLEPRYVSTVDSGNLAGHLLVLKRICHEYMDAEILPASQLEGLADLVSLVKESAVDLPSNLRVQAFGRAHMLEAVEALEGLLSPAPADPGEWAVRMPAWLARTDAIVDVARSLVLEQNEDAFAELLSRAEFLHASLDGMVRDMRAFFAWTSLATALEGQDGLPSAESARLLHGRISLRDLEASGLAMAAVLRARVQSQAGADQKPDPSASIAVASESGALASALVKAAGEARKLLDRLGMLAAKAERTALEMEFSFLEDPQRKLFAIGFRVREEKLDASFYDLLASEVRLTSFLAVAKGDVPPSHWFRLGRTLTPVGKGATLLSWSGSMFEYLMPVLVMRSPPGSLLESACRYAVKRQIDYGNANGTPWGISEAAYNIRDIEMTYQYSSFGVPGLGLKRGLSGDLVIAPYATGLAAMVAPREAAENLNRLRAEGAEGAYGFYEAVDFTKVRLQEG